MAKDRVSYIAMSAHSSYVSSLSVFWWWLGKVNGRNSCMSTTAEKGLTGGAWRWGDVLDMDHSVGCTHPLALISK